jgi:hypothetical protein
LLHSGRFGLCHNLISIIIILLAEQIDSGIKPTK